VDIIAVYKGKYFIVSCKSGNYTTKKNAIEDLKGTLSIFGRFAIPLLSYFRHRGEPELRDGVYVFGVDILCETHKMQEFLNKTIEHYRTTKE
ncbi:MAG: hypothetical protein N2738_08365, partial [Thermodesulfovibrionales bacterium]|nr:hypothetical protein [Thermodesulfovibrionales bacterium]